MFPIAIPVTLTAGHHEHSPFESFCLGGKRGTMATLLAYMARLAGMEIGVEGSS